jgi:hypothetical protein
MNNGGEAKVGVFAMPLLRMKGPVAAAQFD